MSVLGGLDGRQMSLLEAARADVGVFADRLVGEPLWPHQLEAARSDARIRVLRAGRQVGKTRLLAMLALWSAFRRRDQTVLVLSATESNAKDLLAEVIALATGSGLLAGSVADDQAARLVLDNGSVIRSIPASARQARGKSVDLLIVDEAAFLADEVWSASKYTIAARPGARVVMASSPFGRRDAFFAQHDRLGADGGSVVAGVSVETFVWPSTVSPLVVASGMVEYWRRTDPPRQFAAEVLAEWQDEQGAFLSSEEISGNVADFEMLDPSVRRARGQLVVGGVDWGNRQDANTLALLGVLDDRGLNSDRHRSDVVFFVPWLEEHFRVPYDRFIDRVVEVAGVFDLYRVASETNGVGQMPTEMLERRLWERRTGSWVSPVHTTARRKESMFGALKLLLQQGRLVLPRHPGLLGQLAALEVQTLDSGLARISVPERMGHDDLVMALGQAVSCLRIGWPGREGLSGWGRGVVEGEVLETEMGTAVPRVPVCLDDRRYFTAPRGEEEPERGW